MVLKVRGRKGCRLSLVFAEANVSPRNLSSYEIRRITFLNECVNIAIKTKTRNLYDFSF